MNQCVLGIDILRLYNGDKYLPSVLQNMHGILKLCVVVVDRLKIYNIRYIQNQSTLKSRQQMSILRMPYQFLEDTTFQKVAMHVLYVILGSCSGRKSTFQTIFQLKNLGTKIVH